MEKKEARQQEGSRLGCKGSAPLLQELCTHAEGRAVWREVQVRQARLHD